jgi:hypothetical protein
MNVKRAKILKWCIIEKDKLYWLIYTILNMFAAQFVSNMKDDHHKSDCL